MKAAQMVICLDHALSAGTTAVLSQILSPDLSFFLFLTAHHKYVILVIIHQI